MSDKVLENGETRMYVDDWKAGVLSTLPQAYTVEGPDQVVWRPILYIGKANTTAELSYGKVDRESLRILSGIRGHRIYLNGTRYICVVDNELLLTLKVLRQSVLATGHEGHLGEAVMEVYAGWAWKRRWINQWRAVWDIWLQWGQTQYCP